jgi:hypothetical protein
MTSDPLARRAAAPLPQSVQFAAALRFRPSVLDLSDPDVRALSIETLALALATLEPGSDLRARLRSDSSAATAPFEHR